MKRLITSVACFFLCSILISCATTKQVTLSSFQTTQSKKQLLTSAVRIKTTSPDKICDASDPPKCVSTPTILSSGALVETTNGVKGILTVAHALTVFGPKQRIEVHATLINGKTFPAKASICDYEIDVCFIFIDESAFDDDRFTTLKQSPIAPVWGDDAWFAGDPVSIASDFAQFGGNIFPLLHGSFSGSSRFMTPWGMRKISMVTIPGAHGASGSSIVNNRFEIIGVVQMVHPTFMFSTLTIEYGDLMRFLNSILSFEEYKTQK